VLLMSRKRIQSGFRVGQIVVYRHDRVRIKAFPTPHTAMVVPAAGIGANWVLKVVALSELRP
jgi:hypothetical protein